MSETTTQTLDSKLIDIFFKAAGGITDMANEEIKATKQAFADEFELINARIILDIKHPLKLPCAEFTKNCHDNHFSYKKDKK